MNFKKNYSKKSEEKLNMAVPEILVYLYFLRN